jgi:hypothetical protein
MTDMTSKPSSAIPTRRKMIERTVQYPFFFSSIFVELELENRSFLTFPFILEKEKKRSSDDSKDLAKTASLIVHRRTNKTFPHTKEI